MKRYEFIELFDRSHNGPAGETDLAVIGDEIGVSPAGPWIAGGAVRRTLIDMPLESDVDVFCASEEQRAKLLVLLGSGDRLGENDFCVTIRCQIGGTVRVVQIIKPLYPTLESALETFDFTICQTGFDGRDVVVGDYTLWDLGRKRLVPCKITYGVASIRRLIKYTRQGFSVCGGGIANILHQIVADPAIVNAQTQYID